MSSEAQNNYLYDAATAFIEEAAEKAREEEEKGVRVSQLFLSHFGNVMDFKQLERLSDSLKKVHDHFLEKKVGWSCLRKCGQKPTLDMI